MPKARPWRTMPVQQQRRRLRDLVVLDEELLELVNDQQRPRDRLGAAGPLVAGEVLHAELAEQVAAALQFVVHALQHAQAELPVALDGDHPRVRQPVGGVALELDALLEVHQVELHLLRAAPQRQVGDDDVEQGGLARTGLAGDQRVLAGALADGEVLELGRARAADRARAARSVVSSRPDLRLRRGDVRERHLDAAGIPAARPTLLTNSIANSGGGGASSTRSVPGIGFAGQQELRSLCRSGKRCWPAAHRE